MENKAKLKNTCSQEISFIRNHNFDTNQGWWVERKKILHQNSKSMMEEKGHPSAVTEKITSNSVAEKRASNYDNIIDRDSESFRVRGAKVPNT